MSNASKCTAKDPNKCRYHGKVVNTPTSYSDFEKEQKKSNPEGFVHDQKFRNIKKMPALFVTNWETHEVTEEINPKAAWIFSEPAHPTLKKDGTSITINEDGTIYARRAVKKGKTAPEGFIAAETDPNTGHTFGLEPVAQSGFYKMFTQALKGKTLPPGTYELCGPKINGNPEKLTEPVLYPHGAETATDIPDMRTVKPEEAYAKLKEIFSKYKENGVEGVVWIGANGKRAKLRVKDFFGDPNRR